jgi:hypothetical protein
LQNALTENLNQHGESGGAARALNFSLVWFTFWPVPRILIKVVNLVWLVIIFIGVPAITHAQVGNWDITEESTARLLIFGGLALAAIGNGIAAMLLKKHKDQILCWEWAAIFGGLLIVQYACANGYLNFNWLKKVLQWMQSKL